MNSLQFLWVRPVSIVFRHVRSAQKEQQQPQRAVEDVQHAPVDESVLPAPSVTYTTPTPVVYDIAPTPAVTYAEQALVDEYSAPAPAVSFAALTLVVKYMAPTPALTSAAPAPVSVQKQRTVEPIVDVPML